METIKTEIDDVLAKVKHHGEIPMGELAEMLELELELVEKLAKKLEREGAISMHTPIFRGRTENVKLRFVAEIEDRKCSVCGEVTMEIKNNPRTADRG